MNLCQDLMFYQHNNTLRFPFLLKKCDSKLTNAKLLTDAVRIH